MWKKIDRRTEERDRFASGKRYPGMSHARLLELERAERKAEKLAARRLMKAEAEAAKGGHPVVLNEPAPLREPPPKISKKIPEDRMQALKARYDNRSRIRYMSAGRGL